MYLNIPVCIYNYHIYKGMIQCNLALQKMKDAMYMVDHFRDICFYYYYCHYKAKEVIGLWPKSSAAFYLLGFI